MKAAKVFEQNAHTWEQIAAQAWEVSSEQVAVNEALTKEASRVRQELTASLCVICLNALSAKSAKAFVPCGHVCVHPAGTDLHKLVVIECDRCPKCRQDVQFSFTVFL